MNNIQKAALTILVMVAVLVYTVLNYVNGKIDLTYFLVFVVVLGIPLCNMVNILIKELKSK